jgi:hypothetical protein
MLDSDLLSPGRILANVSINSKKRLLELISLTMAKTVSPPQPKVTQSRSTSYCG